MKNIQYGTEFLDQLKDRVHEQQWEIERLNNIIENMEEELTNIYIYFGYNDEEIKNEIKKLKGVDK